MISLICMPWMQPEYPSLPVGILHSTLKAAGLAVRSHSLHLLAMEHWAGHLPDFHLSWFDRVSGAYEVSLPDFVFSVPPFRDPDPAWDEAFRALTLEAGHGEELFERARLMRDATPGLLERAAEELQRGGARVLGFTCGYGQRVASLALSALMKQRDPSLLTVFGGPNCEGEMGEALLRNFPQVDVVVRGAGEPVVAPLMRALLAGQAPQPTAGLCFRQGGKPVIAPMAEVEPTMPTAPLPDFDEYFERLARSPLRKLLTPKVEVLFESSRGCWWGQKQHCTFCGLNGSTMAYRPKSPDQVEAEVLALSRRHGVLRFRSVDNILANSAPRDLMPRFNKLHLDFFYETKSNLRLDEVRALASAGVLAIQPGIESLNSELLRRMRKGVGALQNVALLKWCAEYDIQVFWNLIFGFPGESEADYERMAGWVDSLVHLQPPHLAALEINRFSPYHRTPEAFGLRVIGPTPATRLLYPIPESEQMALSYAFEHEHLDGRDPRRVAAPMLRKVAEWQSLYKRNVGRLVWRRGPDFVRVVDLRSNTPSAQFHLQGLGEAVFLAADRPGSPAAVRSRLAAAGFSAPIDAITAVLDRLVEQKIALEELGRYVTLPVAARPRQPSAEPLIWPTEQLSVYPA